MNATVNANRFALGLGLFVAAMIVLTGYVVPATPDAQARLRFTLRMLELTGAIVVVVFSVVRRTWPMALAGAGLLLPALLPDVRWLSLLGGTVVVGTFFYAYRFNPAALTGKRPRVGSL